MNDDDDDDNDVDKVDVDMIEILDDVCTCQIANIIAVPKKKSIGTQNCMKNNFIGDIFFFLFLLSLIKLFLLSSSSSSCPVFNRILFVSFSSCIDDDRHPRRRLRLC